MSRLRSSAKPLIALVAVVAAALVFSACAYFKGGSLTISQPAGVGAAQVHFQLCTDPDPTNLSCNPTEDAEELQYLLGVAVPPGSVPPATVTAVPVGGGAPIVFTRNDEVTAQLTAESGNLEKVLIEAEGSIPPGIPGVKAWPPSGLQGFGYLSSVHQTQVGETTEWNVDFPVELPVPAEGAPYPGPFETALNYGFRLVDGAHPANRPVKCAHIEKEAMPNEEEAFCLGVGLQGQAGTSDLKVGAPKKVSAFVGGKGMIAFPLKFASSSPSYPAFSLVAKSSLKKAKVKLSKNSYTAAAPDPSTHLSAPGKSTVTVSVPKNAKPGTYEVTLTATAAPGGGVVSQIAKLKVTKPKLKLGGIKLNKGAGTAKITVKVPGAGTLTATGKGLVKAKKKSKKAKKLKLTLKPTGATKGLLASTGSAKVKVKLTFKPSSGIAAKATKAITLKQN